MPKWGDNGDDAQSGVKTNRVKRFTWQPEHDVILRNFVVGKMGKRGRFTDGTTWAKVTDYINKQPEFKRQEPLRERAIWGRWMHHVKPSATRSPARRRLLTKSKEQTTPPAERPPSLAVSEKFVHSEQAAQSGALCKAYTPSLFSLENMASIESLLLAPPESSFPVAVAPLDPENAASLALFSPLPDMDALLGWGLFSDDTHSDRTGSNSTDMFAAWDRDMDAQEILDHLSRLG